MEHRSNAHLYLWGITILAGALRFYGLSSESLWVDEGLTIHFSDGGIGDLFNDWTQGPLFLILIKLMRGLAGTTEFTLRFLPAIFGILCIPAIYFVGKRAFNQSVGLFSAFFLAINPFAIHYSQDARPYTLFLLGTLTTLYCTFRLAQEFRWRDVIYFALSIQIVLYSHPYGVFFLPVIIGTFFLYWNFAELAERKGKLKRFILAASLAALMFIPQLIRLTILFFDKVESGKVASWIVIPDLKDLFHTATAYFMMPRLAYAVFLLILFALLYRRMSQRPDRILLMFIGVLLLCAWILPWVISLTLAPIYVTRYTIPALAAFILALGWAVSVFPRGIRIAAILFILCVTVKPLYYYYTKADKDPWRQTAELIRQNMHDEDLIVTNTWYNQYALSYYLNAENSVRVIAPPNHDNLSDLVRHAPTVWFVKAYGREQKALTQSIESTIQDYCKAGTSSEMKKQLQVNPWVMNLDEISVTKYLSYRQAEDKLKASSQ